MNMPRPPSPASLADAHGIALGVKDGLRQVRLQLRVGARAVADQIEAGGPLGAVPGERRPPWAAPLQGAALQMLQWIDAADRAAGQLLGSSARQSELQRALAPLARVACGPEAADADRDTARAWYAAWNHLLRLQGVQAALVPEGGLHQLLRALRAAIAAAPAESPAARLVLQALAARPSLLQPAAGAGSTPQDERRTLLRVAAAFAVACESMAAGAPGPADAASRLALADELVVGRLARWDSALAAPEPAAALGREVDFSARHL